MLARSRFRTRARGPGDGSGSGGGGGSLTPLAQILALDPTALWWPSEATMTVARDGTGAAPTAGEPVGRMLDLTPNAINAIAASDAERPLLADDPTRLTWDKVDDRLRTTMPATTGKMVLSTPEGTAVYGVNISAGSYDVGGRGGDYFPGTSLVGQTIGDFTDEEAASIATIFKAAGGGDNYGSVTNFTRFWRGWSELTSFPEIDTSGGSNFEFAWFSCSSLTTFPALDVSGGTTFTQAWRNCSSLTTFPANMFNSVTATSFSLAFTNTNLSQTSIDNILVSINTAGTSSGTFGQSGGSAPSATGEAAIDALRGRGWSVTVTGGY